MSQLLDNAEMLNWTHNILPEPDSVNTFTRLLESKTQAKNILEIGSFVGTSLIGLLNICKEAKGYSIDIWNNNAYTDEKNRDESLQKINFSRIEKIFDDNIKISGMESRIIKCKGDSKKILKDLNIMFDVIYVDGSHTAFNVHYDLLLSWLHLTRGGILIIDDYTWNLYPSVNPLEIPYFAINHFLETYSDEYEILYKNYRIF